MEKRLIVVPKAKQETAKRTTATSSVPPSPASVPTVLVELHPVHDDSPRKLIVEWRFDGVGLHFPVSYVSLLSRLPEGLVKIKPKDKSRYAHQVKLTQATQYQYRAQMRLVEPSAEFWQELLPYEFLLGNYKASYVELAFDIPCQSMEEAKKVVTFLLDHVRKKYHHSGKVVTYEGEHESMHYMEERSSTSNLAFYPRRGKRDDRNFFARVEFRFRSAERIKRKLGIVTLHDFLTFDPLPFFRKHFLLESINYEQLGCWLSDRRSPSPGEEDEKFKRNAARLKGWWYCRHHEIRLAAELRAHLRKQRRRLKNLTRDLDPLEKKWSKLTWHRMDQFFTPLVLPSSDISE